MTKIFIDNELYVSDSGRYGFVSERGAKISFSKSKGKKTRLLLESDKRLVYTTN